MSPRSRVREMDRQAMEENSSGPSTLKTSQALDKSRERERTAKEFKRAKGGADLRSKIDYRCADEYPVRMRGTMFGGLVRIPTDPTIDPPERVCFNCWGMSHPVQKCPQPQKRLFCHNCGRVGVDFWKCPRCGPYQRRAADARWMESKVTDSNHSANHSKPQATTGQQMIDRVVEEKSAALTEPAGETQEERGHASAEAQISGEMPASDNTEAPASEDTAATGGVSNAAVVFISRSSNVRPKMIESIVSSTSPRQITIAETLQLLQSVEHLSPATQDIILRRVFGADSSEPTSH